MNILFAGGGTGGHLYPAVAMAGELKKLDPGVAISFAGTTSGIEATEVPRLGYPLHLLPVRGLKRGRSLSALIGNLGVLSDFALSLGRAAALIWREAPDVVVGTGGFVSGPMLLAAQLMGKKTLIQEQNAFPGVTTKLLSRLATEVHIAFEEARGFLHKKEGVFVTGNPSRTFIVQEPDSARARFGLHHPRPTLLVFGGSRGARSINNAVLKRLDEILAGANLIWQTGSLDFDRIRGQVKSSESLFLAPYIEDMGAAYGAADLVVCRAGASSIAELTNLGKPSVLIPYPFATGDHQRHNARSLNRGGAAIVVEDSDLDADAAIQEILGLLQDAGRRKEMGAAALRLAYPDAARQLALRIVSLAQQH